MKILFDEQDVVDACSVFLGHEHRRRPDDIQVDLQYDEIRGYAAEGKVGFRTVLMTEQDMIDGVALYLSQYHQFSPNSLRVQFAFDDINGIQASVDVF